MTTAIKAKYRPVDVITRQPAIYWMSGAAVLLALQLADGTDPVFALLIFLFVVATCLTVTLLGGPLTLPGAGVTMLALQHVIISQVAKVAFWQPADPPLVRPIETAGMYATGMAAMLVAAALTRKYRPKPLFPPETDVRRLYWLAVLTIAFSVFRYAVLERSSGDASGGVETGGAIGPLRTITFLGPLAVASATAYVLLESQGRKSIGRLNVIAIAIPTIMGFVGAGRSSMVLAFITYMLTCYAFRFKFRPVHYATVISLAVFAQFILFPYALYARNFTRSGTFEQNMSRAADLFIDFATNPLKYQAIMDRDDTRVPKVRRHLMYYGKKLPTLDRYTVLVLSDGLVDAVHHSGTTGMETIEPGFLMLLPRFLNPDKPMISVSSHIAHRVPGLIGKNDFTTGVTLGFFGDAFTSYGWPGIALIPFIVMYCYCIVYRRLLDDRIWFNVPTISLLFSWPWTFSEAVLTPTILSILMAPAIVAVTLWTLQVIANLLERLNTRLTRRPASTDAPPQLSRGAASQ